jgi:hypothetical protein
VGLAFKKVFYELQDDKIVSVKLILFTANKIKKILLCNKVEDGMTLKIVIGIYYVNFFLPPIARMNTNNSW